DGNERIRLCVSDTGPGLPADFATRQSRSLGLQLVSDLARQLLGTLEVAPDSTFTLTFPAHRRDSGDIPR
ncbi:MAG: histidine kinase, partial [Vicinamibacteria bacterium]